MHNNDISWAPWCIKSPARRLHAQKLTEIDKKTIKFLQHQSFWLETTCDRLIPLTTNTKRVYTNS